MDGLSPVSKPLSWYPESSLKKTHALFAATKDQLELREVSTQAEGLFLSLLCLGITDLFIHAAYTMLLPVLAGMTISLEHTTRPLLAAARRRKATATVTRVVPGRPAAGAPGLLSGAS